MKNLMPLIERNQTNGISQAEEERDRIYDLFVQVASSQQVEILILKSPPFNSPPWVQVECWTRHPTDSALTLRSTAELTFRPREFHRYPIEIDIKVSKDRRWRKWQSVVEFDVSHAETVLLYMLYDYSSYTFPFRRCRLSRLQLWLPDNKPARLGLDPRALAVPALFVVGILTLGFPIIGVPLLGAGSILAFLNYRRPRHVLSAGKPSQEPRSLIRLDSWQALVRNLGAQRDVVKRALTEELTQLSEGSFVMAEEKIWYWGVDGKEEREQLVVRFRRGIAFVHIYKYGNDLFVGWDAHVNCGTWTETVSAQGYDKLTQALCAVHTIAADWHVPNEYDITDTNCLLERVHAAVTKVLKIKIAEHKIDQEIDFKILREARQQIVGRQGSEEASVQGNLRSRLSKLVRVG